VFLLKFPFAKMEIYVKPRNKNLLCLFRCAMHPTLAASVN
jgi:hypothetical protein